MEIKINDLQWHSLSQSEKDSITKIVSGYFKGASIVPDTATPPVDMGGLTTQGLLGLPDPICKAVCGILEAAAIAACSTIGGPIAVATCIAVSKVAGEACRNSC